MHRGMGCRRAVGQGCKHHMLAGVAAESEQAGLRRRPPQTCTSAVTCTSSWRGAVLLTSQVEHADSRHDDTVQAGHNMASVMAQKHFHSRDN